MTYLRRIYELQLSESRGRDLHPNSRRGKRLSFWFRQLPKENKYQD